MQRQRQWLLFWQGRCVLTLTPCGCSQSTCGGAPGVAAVDHLAVQNPAACYTTQLQLGGPRACAAACVADCNTPCLMVPSDAGAARAKRLRTSFADLGHSTASSGRCCRASCSTGLGTGTALLPLPFGLPGWDTTAAICKQKCHAPWGSDSEVTVVVLVCYQHTMLAPSKLPLHCLHTCWLHTTHC
jgi:hypothetical protein